MSINDPHTWEAEIVSHCLEAMRTCPYAQIKLNAAYDLLERMIRVFCVNMEKEAVLKEVNEMHQMLKKEIEANYADEP